MSVVALDACLYTIRKYFTNLVAFHCDLVMVKNILILRGHSLFTDGIVSKLTRSALLDRFRVIDLCQSNPIQQILKEQPDVLVLDENDPGFSENLRCKLFRVLPAIKIIFLDSRTTRIRVMQWHEHNFDQLSNLLDEINIVNELNSQMTPYSKERNGELSTNEWGAI